MTESKHTPGPWRFVEREVIEDGTVYPRHIIGGARDLEICPLEHSNIAALATHGDAICSSDIMMESATDARSKLANAHLIAAAPEMLEALTKARAAFIVEYAKDGSVAAVGYDSNALRPLVLLLDSAIAKAEGRS